MSKRYFISTSRIVLSITAAGIVGLAATPQAEAAEVTAVAETPASNAASTEATSSEVVAEEAPANEERNPGDGYQFDVEFPPQVTFTGVQGFDRPRTFSEEKK